MSEQTIQRVPSRPHVVDTAMPKFWDEDLAAQRKIYLKIIIGGCVGVIIAIFAILSIYWGALWKSPVRPLQGWVVVSTRLVPLHQHAEVCLPRFTGF